MTIFRNFFLFALLMPVQVIQAAGFDHSSWDQLLKTYVQPLHNGKASQVDYAGLQRNRGQLISYLNKLSLVDRDTFDAWPQQEQLAFLINAYNAWTVKLIIDNYPGLESIKDLGSWFSTPWNRSFIPLLDERRSLDDIEHNLIRGSGRYNDPRIHFAVNCASIGCPALRSAAYTGAGLEDQLETAARNFLADRERNRLRGDTLEVSSIFKWYRGDFERGWHGSTSLREFLARYDQALGLTATQKRALIDDTVDIDFLAYDWRLNDLRR